MASMAGPREMHRDTGAPFGVFNLAKFRAEVASRVGVARHADASGSAMSNYMKGNYDGPPRTSTSSPMRTTGSVAIEDRLQRQDGDEAYERLQRKAQRSQLSSSLSLLESSDGDLSRSQTSLERRALKSGNVIPAPRSAMHLEADPYTTDGIRWNMPEKWYSLTQHSAQSTSLVERHRTQSNRPLLGTRPSENPYSVPPSLVNHFADVSHNPRLTDGKQKKKRHHHDPDEDTSSPKKVGIARFGHLRKCNIPFTEGWKRATFKPAKEKLVPYRGKVRKWFPNRGYGFIALAVDGQEVFVHKDDVLVPGGELPLDKQVVFEMNLYGRRGPEARNVRMAGGSDSVPKDMSEEEYRDLVTRRQQDDEVRAIFATGFWKYPKSEETLPEEKGGLGQNYMPYEKDVSFDRLMTITNPLTDAQAARREPPPVHLRDAGPDLSAKLARKPWLARSLRASPSRHPLTLPPCTSYFTSPVITSQHSTKAPKHQLSILEAAARTPSPLRASLYPPPNPPVSNQASRSSVGAVRSFESLPS